MNDSKLRWDLFPSPWTRHNLLLLLLLLLSVQIPSSFSLMAPNCLTSSQQTFSLLSFTKNKNKKTEEKVHIPYFISRQDGFPEDTRARPSYSLFSSHLDAHLNRSLIRPFMKSVSHTHSWLAIYCSFINFQTASREKCLSHQLSSYWSFPFASSPPRCCITSFTSSYIVAITMTVFGQTFW